MQDRTDGDRGKGGKPGPRRYGGIGQRAQMDGRSGWRAQQMEYGRLRIFSAALLIVLGAMAFASAPAHSQETVQARGWSKATYGRIIFDWQKPVEYSAEIQDGQLVVEFARPMRGDLERVVKNLGGYVTSAELAGNGKQARFGLAGSFEVASFATGASVVVDLRRSSGAAAAPVRTPAATASASGGLRVNVGRHPGFTRLVFDWPNKTDYTIARDGRSVALRFDASANIDVQALDKTLPKPAFGTPSASAAGGDLVVNLTIPELSYIRHFREDAKIVLDVQEEGADFGNMLVGATAGATMETISPNGDVVVIPAMVGSHVAVSPDSIPLVTEDGDGFQGNYSPLTHYDPNASGRPRNLLLYDSKASQPKSLNGS